MSELGSLYFHGDAERPASPCAQGHLYLSMRHFAIGRAGEAGERHPRINELRRPRRRINIQPDKMSVGY